MTAVMVTGAGVLSPAGVGAAAHWQATLAGRSGIGRVTRFDPSRYPATLGGEVTGFDPKDRLPSRLVPQTDRMTQFALVAAEEAVADSGVRLADLDELGLAVITASAGGGFEYGQRELQSLWGEGPGHVSAYLSFAWFYAVNSGQISIRHNMRGPSGVFVSDQAGGLDAVAHARRQVRKGVRLALTGAMDGPLCPYAWAYQLATEELSLSTDRRRAYLPFDRAANGYVPGEGGAILLVESAEDAVARGAEQIYGEIAGYAATFDPRPGSGREPGLRRAIDGALADAGVTPDEVDVVFADAAGIPERDDIEAAAITAVFGPHGVAVTAPKTLTGRLYSGGAPVDVVTALLALRHGVIPGTPGVAEPVPRHRLDLVIDKRVAPLRVALVIARGRGGFNAAMVLRGAPTR